MTLNTDRFGEDPVRLARHNVTDECCNCVPGCAHTLDRCCDSLCLVCAPVDHMLNEATMPPAADPHLPIVTLEMQR